MRLKDLTRRDIITAIDDVRDTSERKVGKSVEYYVRLARIIELHCGLEGEPRNHVQIADVYLITNELASSLIVEALELLGERLSLRRSTQITQKTILDALTR